MDFTNTEHVKAVGVGVIEKWVPEDLERKFALEDEYKHLGPVLAAQRALAELAEVGIVPIERLTSRNILVNTGLTDIGNGLITAGLALPYSAANAHLGVGDSATAAAVTQTDLQAATNKFRKAMDGGFPTVSNGVYTFRSTYSTAEANFVWAEWAVFNAATAGRMLNRSVAALGTKPNTQSWQLTTTVTIT